MKAKLERDWSGRFVRVWLYRESRSSMLVLRMKDGDLREWEEVEAGAATEPTLFLENEAVEAILAAGTDFLPPSGAQAAHLQDARSMCDRLLKMVEANDERRG